MAPGKTPARPSKSVLARSRIIRMLDRYGIPWKSWGRGTSRTLNDLFTYHERDRLHFRETESGLVIDVHAVVVIVRHRYRRRWLELYEDRQEFPNRRVLRRTNFNGIAETMSRSETRTDAARRCLSEELHFGDPSKYRLSRCIAVEHREPVPSEKWPGLWAAYHRHIFECVISRSLFNPGGYVEHEENRRIYFKWKLQRGNYQGNGAAVASRTRPDFRKRRRK